MSKLPPTGRQRHGARWIIAAGLFVLGAVTALALVELPRRTLAPRGGPQLASAQSWGYQLQKVNALSVPVGIDVLVVDYSRDGSGDREVRPEQVEALRRRQDGRERIVLAYMSVGEAETYRFYWRTHWKSVPPAWLGPENPSWRHNHPVRFWDPGWQRLIMRPKVTALGRLLELQAPWRKPYIDRIIEAGFDGVYLDRVDVYEEWKGERGVAEQDMVGLVASIGTYARQRRPGFLVVVQNGEELLRHPSYLRAIDGIAKEDLVFGINGDGRRNRAQDYLASLALLRQAQAAGRKVLVVEYIDDAEQRAEVLNRLAGLGFLVQFARRALDQPPEAPAAN